MADQVFYLQTFYALSALWMTLILKGMWSDAKAEHARVRAEIRELKARRRVLERKIHDIKYGVRQEK